MFLSHSSVYCSVLDTMRPAHAPPHQEMPMYQCSTCTKWSLVKVGARFSRHYLGVNVRKWLVSQIKSSQVFSKLTHHTVRTCRPTQKDVPGWTHGTWDTAHSEVKTYKYAVLQYWCHVPPCILAEEILWFHQLKPICLINFAQSRPQVCVWLHTPTFGWPSLSMLCEDSGHIAWYSLTWL